MSNPARLVYAILEFLDNEIVTDAVSQEAAESLDVAKQCLENAYGVTLENTHLSTGRPLIDMFCEGSGLSQVSAGTTIGLTLDTSPEEQSGVPTAAAAAEPAVTVTASAAAAAEPAVTVTEEDKKKAEEVKNEGNEFMKQSRFEEAAEAYCKAVVLDSTNPIYFSNRAAAYNKIQNYQGAIDDCQKALSLDPDYSKAYGRLGLAYTGLKELTKAKEAYQKACALDPSNDSYQTNLKIAELKLRETNLQGNSASPVPGINLGNMGPSLGGLDLSTLMSNPTLMNMASSMLQNPNMQQMMQSMMGQAMQGNAADGSGTDSSAAMGNLIQMGQQLASQIQTENPELVEQVRQMSQNPNPYDGDNNNQPQPPPPPPPPGGNDS